MQELKRVLGVCQLRLTREINRLRLIKSRIAKKGYKDSKRRVYIHVDLKGIVLGNGGYIGLTSLYEKLTELGYEVYFFDPFCPIKTPARLINIRPESEYLSCEGLPIVGMPFVRRDNAPKVIISVWMTQQFYNAIVSNHWENSFIFLDAGQLLRKGYDTERGLVKSLLDKRGLPLLTSNRYLEPFYKDYSNIERVAYLDNFVRDIFYYDEKAKKSNTIGYQPELTLDDHRVRTSETALQLAKSASRVTESLGKCIGEDSLIFCTGSHEDVAQRMRQCDIFFWHNLSNVNPELFVGESFGRSMIEAISCGCVTIAKENYFTQQILPRELLCSNLEEGIQILNQMLAHPDDKNRLRVQCLEIAKNYRFEGFNNERLKTISQIMAML